MTGETIYTTVGIVPISRTDSQTATGSVINRTGYDSVTFAILLSAASGSPTGISVAYKLQHGSAADGSDMADVTGASGTITSASSCTEFNYNLRDLKQYIRLVATVSLTGGSSPSIIVGAACMLGDARVIPC